MSLALSYEALAVGVVTVLLGVVLHHLSLQFYGQHDLNDMKMFAVHLFFIGVVVHLLCEVTGVNKWYCSNGVACQVN